MKLCVCRSTFCYLVTSFYACELAIHLCIIINDFYLSVFGQRMMQIFSYCSSISKLLWIKVTHQGKISKDFSCWRVGRLRGDIWNKDNIYWRCCFETNAASVMGDGCWQMLFESSFFFTQGCITYNTSSDTLTRLECSSSCDTVEYGDSTMLIARCSTASYDLLLRSSFTPNTTCP